MKIRNYLIIGVLTLLMAPVAFAADEEIQLNLVDNYNGTSADAMGDYVGFAVATGDVNGDGYADMLASAPRDEEILQVGSNETEAVYLVYGGGYGGAEARDFNLANADAKFLFEDGFDAIKISLATGDVNGDGYEDIIIGGAGMGGGYDKGLAYVVYGSATDYSGEISLANANVTYTGETDQDYAGCAVSAGDINGDGYDDILIGAYYEDTNGESAGATYLIYGAAMLGSMSLDNAAAKLLGQGNSIWSGYKVEARANINGDAYNDILISAPYWGGNTGAVYVVYGQESSLTGDITLGSVRFLGENTGDRAGYGLSYAGDVNGDGIDDFLVGADNYLLSQEPIYAGAVYLVYGQEDYYSLDTALATTVKYTGEATYNQAGYAFSNAGDVNNDGYGDFAISAPWADSTVNDVGAVYIILGSDSLVSGSLTDADYKFIGEGIANHAGQSLAFASDFDGDRHEELFIGAPYVSDAGTNAGAVYVVNYRDLMHASDIISVEGAKNGNIKVTYADNSEYTINVYNITTSKKTKVKQYRSTAYALVLQPKGKKISLVNMFSGSVEKTRNITSAAYKYNNLKILKLRGKYFAVVTSKKANNTVRLSINRIKINSETITKTVKKKFKSKKTKVGKTKKKGKNKIQIRRKNGTVIKQFEVTSTYKLKAL